MKIGEIETLEHGIFRDLYSVQITKDEGYLTNSLDNARIMSMLAKICKKLEINLNEMDDKEKNGKI